MSRGQLRAYVQIWMSHNVLPHPCEFCGDPVTALGRHGTDGVIHHRDGDHGNDSVDNLACCHNSCHVSHHQTGRETSPTHRQRLSAATTARFQSEAERATVSARMMGNSNGRGAVRTPEQRERYSAAQRKRWADIRAARET